MTRHNDPAAEACPPIRLRCALRVPVKCSVPVQIGLRLPSGTVIRMTYEVTARGEHMLIGAHELFFLPKAGIAESLSRYQAIRDLKGVAKFVHRIFLEKLTVRVNEIRIDTKLPDDVMKRITYIVDLDEGDSTELDAFLGLARGLKAVRH